MAFDPVEAACLWASAALFGVALGLCMSLL